MANQGNDPRNIETVKQQQTFPLPRESSGRTGAPKADDNGADSAGAGQLAATALSQEPQSDIPPTKDGRRAVVITTLICALFAAGGHVALLLPWLRNDSNPVLPTYWPPVVGISVSVVAMTAFGGFFYASLRARVAMGASFILIFFLLLSYALTISEFGTSGSALSGPFVDDFRVITQTVIAFYFGTEALIATTKIIKTPASMGGQAIGRADRDLPSGS